MIVLGIDVGLKGGFCLLDLDKNQILKLQPMPVVKIKKAKGIKTRLDEGAIKEFLYTCIDNYSIKAVVIEQQFVKSGQNISSVAFTLEQYGYLVGLCQGLDLKVIRPLAKLWLKAYSDLIVNIDTSLDNKERNIEIVKKLYPEVNIVLPRARTPHTGLADAILIARSFEYFYQYYSDICT